MNTSSLVVYFSNSRAMDTSPLVVYHTLSIVERLPQIWQFVCNLRVGINKNGMI